MTDVRKGQAPPKLERDEFRRRFRAGFSDPAFDAADASVQELENIAWEAYDAGRKAPRTQAAGAGYADPRHELSVEWLEAKARIEAAATTQKDATSSSRVLVICGA